MSQSLLTVDFVELGAGAADIVCSLYLIYPVAVLAAVVLPFVAAAPVPDLAVTGVLLLKRVRVLLAEACVGFQR